MITTNTNSEYKESQKKSIPAKVFFNHFFSISQFIEHDSDRFSLNSFPYFKSIKITNPNCDRLKMQRLLMNSWSTEYALRLNDGNTLNDYNRFAMHWTFPQVYYSVYLAMSAFQETQGNANDNHEKSINLFANSVKHRHYPNSISFYATGLYNDFKFHGLGNIDGKPKDFNGLSRIDSIEDATYQIALFLKSTRIQNAENRKSRLKRNDKEFQNAKRELLLRFSKEHWDKLYARQPVTSLLHLLYRLRIKANYHDINTFINADIDFEQFNTSLRKIVDYLNFIHEAYITKAIGLDDYRKYVDSFPNHLNEETVIRRLKQYILPLFK